MELRPVGDDQWTIVGWLWQAFRHDLSPVVNGLPYADGRYQHGELDRYPGPGRFGYLAWAPHPNTGEDAPVGFALVDDTHDEAHHLAAFFVVPPLRRTGLGRALVAEVLAAHPGRWRIGFQHDNRAAGGFWRAVATTSFADWVESEEAVPGKPDVPADHWITGTTA